MNLFPFKLLKIIFFCCLYNKLYGSEGELFNRFDKLNKQGTIEQNFGNENKDNKNNIINVEDIDNSEKGSSDALQK